MYVAIDKECIENAGKVVGQSSNWSLCVGIIVLVTPPVSGDKLFDASLSEIIHPPMHGDFLRIWVCPRGGDGL